MTISKRDKLMRKVENHLRLTARQLLKFDTEEEVLQYLADSFQSRLDCDFVGVITKEDETIQPKVWSGELLYLKKGFPIKVDHCSPKLFHQSLTFEDIDIEIEENCEFIQLINNGIVKTWFTVPIQDEHQNYGFCTIGYVDYIPLLEMDDTFDEFGKDVALAITLAKRKEQEQKKIMGIEFISKNLSLNESMEGLVEKIVGQAGKGTNATFAGIYLYDEEQNHFKFQPPSYGNLWKPEKILVQKNYVLKEYFPYLETPGGKELTVPLTMDLKTFGVLHVEKKQQGIFTNEELEMLTVMAEHVSSLLRNAYLYKNEKEQMNRLHSLLDYQQILIKKTINEDGFDGITTVVSELFHKPAILFDRFLRPISHHSFPIENLEVQGNEISSQLNFKKVETDFERFSLEIDDITRNFFIWPLNGGRDVVGYLAIESSSEEIDAFDQLAVDLIRNIYSVQFIKQKLVIDTKAQVKDNFMDMLLVENIEDTDTIIQYANLFRWNVFSPHRVAVLSIQLDQMELDSNDILEQQAKKSSLFEELKMKISGYDADIMLAKKGDVHILIVPEEKEIPDAKKYWNGFAERIKKWLHDASATSYGMLGIGGKTKNIEDYYTCYKQAQQTLNVIIQQQQVNDYAFFEDLGSYTLLHLIKDTSEAHYFMRNYLEKLMEHSKGNHINLFQTLREYLEQNGSIKKTSDKLFIHRSTLLYRLERIKEVLKLDIDDSDNRFNLMMTYKLYDLQKNHKQE